jgi:hypothetical protein
MNKLIAASLSSILIIAATGMSAPKTGRPVAAPVQPAKLYATVNMPAQSGCVDVLPVEPVFVAPGQPAIGTAAAATPDQSGNKTATPTAGIINALCDVTLNIVGCGFSPAQVSLTCDTTGDGVPDLTIPLTNVTAVDANLVQATLSVSQSGLSGSAFPLFCCGGIVTLTLSVTVSAGDNNIFGPFTLTQTCNIDVGQRAPVVISASPSGMDCSVPDDVLIPGSCFVLPGSVVNVTSVFGVDTSDATNVVQASNVTVLSPNLIDAVFNFGGANAGKTFLIFASGPNGTSRNLSQLPEGLTNCVLGNEQGIQVTLTCASAPPQPSAIVAVVSGCSLSRTAAGAELLTVTGSNIESGAAVTIGQGAAKSVKYSGLDPATNMYTQLTLKGGFCKFLPGQIVITNPGQPASAQFQCTKTCN